MPEAWSDKCDQSCRSSSGLSLDTRPNDSDNDGLANDQDTDDNQDGKADADANGDGLVEVHNLAELNAMRFGLDGSGRRLSANGPLDSSGCPARLIEGRLKPLCHGYELVADLDFDINGDGKMDARDQYINGLSKWEPIGSETAPFTAAFEGNGHFIRNLYLKDFHFYDGGLFGIIYGANIANLAFTGPNTYVTGIYFVGLLAGTAVDAQIENIFATGKVESVHGGAAPCWVVPMVQLCAMSASISIQPRVTVSPCWLP